MLAPSFFCSDLGGPCGNQLFTSIRTAAISMIPIHWDI
jgi:hypothetical protein